MSDFGAEFLQDAIRTDTAQGLYGRISAIASELQRHRRLELVMGLIPELAALSPIEGESMMEFIKQELRFTDKHIATIKREVQGKRRTQAIEKARADLPNADLLWDLADNGSLKSTFANIKGLFQVHGMARSFTKNIFSNQIELVDPPAFDTGMDTPTIINTEHIIMFRDWFATNNRLDTSKDNISDVIVALAYPYRHHPVRDYLNGLPVWDGVERLDTMLTAWAGAADNVYTRFVSRMMLVSAVARVMVPGIKYDFMVILEGAQRIGKSLMVKTLAGTWHQEISLTDRDTDTVEKMMGVWFAEVAETPFFNMRDMNAVKSFITTTQDRVRLPYMPRSEEYPRQSVFVGTFNPPEGGYFRDATGNTRFLPVRVNGPINVEEVARWRDQLFAEALAVWRAGAKLYVPHDNRELWTLMLAEQGLRVEVDDWEDIIADWLSRNWREYVPGDYRISSRDIYVKALGGVERDMTAGVSRRIATVMRKLGYECKRMRIKDLNVRGYDISTLAKEPDNPRPY